MRKPKLSFTLARELLYVPHLSPAQLLFQTAAVISLAVCAAGRFSRFHPATPMSGEVKSAWHTQRDMPSSRSGLIVDSWEVRSFCGC